MEEEKLLKKKKRAKAEQNLELLASTLKKLGELYHSKGQYEEALEAHEEERELWTNIGKPMLAAVANRMMGEIYCSLGEYKDALRKLKEYFDVAAAEKNLIEEQRALATIGRTYFCMAESVSPSSETEYKRALREAKQAYMMSLKVCDKISNIDRYELLQMRSRLMLNMGLVFECQGDVEKAVEHVQMAITINVKADLYEDTFRCYSSMAALYQRQGNTDLSLKYHNLALEVAERLPDKTQLMCDTLSNKADVYFSVANYKAAKQTLTKAYKICKGSSEDRSLIEINLKLAHLLCESENKLISMSDNDKTTMKQLYDTMGDACCAVKNFNQAIVYYQKMLECCETLGYCGKELLPALISLSQTYKDAGKYDESLKFLQKELDLWDDNPEEACKTSMNIVQLLEQKGAEYNEIIENIKKSHDYALIASNEKLEIKVLNHMLRIQEKYGFTEEASETRNKIDVIKADVSSLGSSCDASDVDDEVETPELINNISLSDILDEPEPVDVESSRPRQARRQPQGVKIVRNEKGETQLQVACIRGKLQRVQQLIALKHPVNVTDNGGWTPLHEVCNHGHENLVELLLDNGANINDPGGDGCEGVTPLHDACSNGHLNIVQILLDRGACIDVRTNDNKTPFNFLMEWWASRAGTLSEDQTRLFENIKDRLQRGLEKAGVSTKSVNIPMVEHTAERTKISDNNKLKHEKKSSKGKEYARKRSWSVVSSESSLSDSDREQTKEPSGIDDSGDDEVLNEYDDNNSNGGSLIFSPVLIEEDSALEYQKVMKGLRKKVVQEPSKKSHQATKIGALIGDSDVVDDWLINDLKDQTRPNKRRKTRDADLGGAKLIGTLRKDVLIGEEPHGNHGTYFMEIEEFPSESEETTQQYNQHVTHPSDKKHPHQSSLLDSGFVCTSEKSAQQSNAFSHSVLETEGCIPSVKIHIENTTLVVPISCSEPSVPLTIDWLAKEAARRFLKLDGREPLLVLLTNDGATLAASDPVTVINDRELTGQITGWKTVSLMQRYEDACSASDSVCVLHIKNCLQECDTTHCLNLSNCGFYLDSLNPLIRSFQHEHSLRELLLGGNALMDDGIQMFSTIKGLPLLEIFDLSCNNITSLGLASLCNFLSHCQSLKTLDLSYNDFEDGWLASIHRISEYLNCLSSLNLRSCGLGEDELISWKGKESTLNLKYLETLDISYNPLGEHGVNGFLCHLNTNKIIKLSVAGTALVNSKCVPKIVECFQRESPLSLRFLDLSDCLITDCELMDLIRCLKTAEHLTTLLLCNNSSLSASSLEALIRMQNVPHVLDFCGCDSLFASFDDKSDNLSMNDFLKKLNSLSITCSGAELQSTSLCWSDKIEEHWKQIWGDRGRVWNGPSGLLKFELAKIEEQ